MQEGEEVPIKYVVPTASASESLNVGFEEFTPFDSFVIPIPEAVSSFYILSLVEKAGDYSNIVFTFFNQTTTISDQISIFYPDLNPAEYITNLSYSTGSEKYSYTSVASQLPTVFKKLDGQLLSISSTSNTVNVNASGDFQFVYANAYDDKNTNGNFESFSWTIYMDKSFISNVSVPTIPESIKQLYPELALHTFVFDYASLYKYSGVTDYKDWVKFIFSGPSHFNSKEILSKAKNFSTGGRVGTTRAGELYNRGDLTGRNSFRNKLKYGH